MVENTRTFVDPSDDRFNEAIATFEDARDAGLTPDPLIWLSRYADVADRLRKFFVNRKYLGDLTRLDGALLPDLGEFGDYDNLELISQGGMGVVYKARRKSTQQIVALKLIRPDLLQGLSPEHRRRILERFITEAQVAALLEHENIVKVYDVGEGSGRPYYSMRYVEGKSLSGLLQSGIMPPKRAAAYIEQIARAIHLAHQHGIIHRDLKPNNILVDTQSDRPLVTDFGLAKLIDRNQDLTQTCDIMGAPPYMSPEQVNNSARATTATDVYGLGATLYALLTGQPPFQGDTPIATLKKVLDEEPTRPRKLNPAVPRDLQTICLKCLEKDPRKRYASALKVAEDLESWREGFGISARPIGPAERAWRWCRRNRRVAALLVCVVLSMLGGTAFSAYFGIEANRHAGIAEENEKKANDSAQQAKEMTEKAMRRAYVSDLRLIERFWLDHKFQLMRDLLKDQRPIRSDALDLRGFEWHYWRRLTQSQREFQIPGVHGSGFRFSADSSRVYYSAHVWDTTQSSVAYKLNVAPGLNYSSAISPDGGTIALANFNAPELWDVQRNQRKLVLKDQRGQVVAMAFSPDGKYLAIASAVWDVASEDYARGEVKILATDTGNVVMSLPGFVDPVLCLAFSGDGKLATGTGRLDAEELFFKHDTGNISKQPIVVQVWNFKTGKEISALRGHDAAITRLLFHPSNQRLLVAGREGSLKMWNLETQLEMFAINDKMMIIPVVAFHPEGKTLATAQGGDHLLVPPMITVWSAENGEGLYFIRGNDRPITDLVYGPDGKHLISVDYDGFVKEWHLVKNREAVTLRGRGFQRGYNAKAGRLTIVDGNNIKVWDLSTAEESLELSIQKQSMSAKHSWDVADKGRYVAVAWEKEVTVWDTKIGKVLRSFEVPAGTSRVQFSPDGERLKVNVNNMTMVWNVLTREWAFPDFQQNSQAENVLTSSDGNKKFGVRLQKGQKLFEWRFSADTKRVHCVIGAVGVDSEPATLRTLDASDGTELSEVALRSVPTRGSRGFYFTPETKALFASGAGTLFVYDVNLGRELYRISGDAPVFSRDGRWVAVLAGTRIRVLDVATGREESSFYNEGFSRFNFSPDGKRLVALRERQKDGIDKAACEIKLWDAAGQELLSFGPFLATSSDSSIGDVFFSDDGNRLILEFANTIRIWDASPAE